MFFPFCKPSQYEGFVKADFPGSWNKSIRGPAGEFPLSHSRTLKPQISAVTQQDASRPRKRGCPPAMIRLMTQPPFSAKAEYQ